MNNTINNTRLSARPSFNGFSQKARKVVNEESISKLIESGKLKFKDFAYLEGHKLEIDVLSADKKQGIEGVGLYILNPLYTGARTTANAYRSPTDIKLTPVKEKLFSSEFLNIEETLAVSLKKALKFFKRFDKIDAQKKSYFEKNGEAIDALLKARKEAYTDYKEALEDVFKNERPVSRNFAKENPYEAVEKLDKKLSKFHNDRYFACKQEKLFSFWKA